MLTVTPDSNWIVAISIIKPTPARNPPTTGYGMSWVYFPHLRAPSSRSTNPKEAVARTMMTNIVEMATLTSVTPMLARPLAKIARMAADSS